MTRILAALLLAACSAASAEWEIGVGMTRFSQVQDGVWYQTPYPHIIDLTSESFRVGVKHGATRAGFEYLGSVYSQALAKGDDRAYLQGLDYPLSSWIGKGRVFGLYATQDFGPLILGVSWHKLTWKMRIPDWIGCDGPSEHDCEFTAPQALDLRGRGDWYLSPIIGVRIGVLEITARNILTHGDPYPSIAHGPAYTAMLTTTW